MIEQLIELANKEPKNLLEMGLKLTEESGEVAQAILSYQKSSGSQYKELSLLDLKEECIDVVLVAISLYYQLEESNTKEFNMILSEKMAKWEKHML